ncbi:MAG: sigma-E processing peptidase SpoIIGA [Clostridia bacterium]|nr:sigma-E processing peptidase SpoIIGA [Clostridia bacterium]
MQNEISVYVDIIFLENLLIDFVIIDISGKAAGYSSKPFRILSGAAVGALYAVLVCVFPCLTDNFFLSLFFKIISSFFMCALSFGLKKRRKILICNVILYIVSFMFAGVFLVLKFTGNPVAVNEGGIVVNWGSSSAVYIIEMLVIGYIIITVFFYYIKKNKRMPRKIYETKIVLSEKSIFVQALCDTGNEIRDNLHNLPVVICESDAFLNLFDENLKSKYFDKTSAKTANDMISVFAEEGFADRISVIPFKTVSSGSDIMIGLAVDYVSIKDETDGEKRMKATVCFVDKKLSETDEYNAIISPEILLCEI